MDPYISNVIASAGTWLGANMTGIVIFVFTLMAITVGWTLVHYAGRALRPKKVR